MSSNPFPLQHACPSKLVINQEYDWMKIVLKIEVVGYCFAMAYPSGSSSFDMKQFLSVKAGKRPIRSSVVSGAFLVFD